MGDLEADTRPQPQGDGRYATTLSDDWEIWGANGGYVAAAALRAAGAECGLPRPASLSCQFLKPGRFDVPLELEVATLRRSKRTAVMRISATQEGVAVLEAQVWGVTEVPGLQHHAAPPRHGGQPHDVPTVVELLAAEGLEPEARFRFWDNFEQRPHDWVIDWEQREADEPTAGGWYRFVPTATFDDPWADACRSVVLADTFGWPAAVRGHREADVTVLGPSLDLHVSFHHPSSASTYLQVHAASPVASHGTIGFSTTVWNEDGQVTALGGGTLLCVPAPSDGPPRRRGRPRADTTEADSAPTA